MTFGVDGSPRIPLLTFRGHTAGRKKKDLFAATEFFWVRGCLLLQCKLAHPDSYKITSSWILPVNYMIQKLAHLIIVITQEVILRQVSNQGLEVESQGSR